MLLSAFVNLLPRTPNRVLSKHLTSNIILANTTLSLMVLAASSGINAMDSITAMSGFGRRFGYFNGSIWTLSPTQQSLFASLPQITDLLAILLARYLTERVGRRVVFSLLVVSMFVGFGLCYSATHFAQLTVGRMFISSVLSGTQYLVPMMHGELCPGALRGRLVAADMVGWHVGGLIITGVARWTSDFQDDRCWRYLLLVYLVMPVIILAASFLLPESPRWLLRQGREQQAARSLKWLYGCRKGYDAELEIQLLKQSVEESKTDAKGKWKDLWKGINRRRTLIVLASCLSNGTNGVALANTFGPIFFRQVSTIQPFNALLIRRGTSFVAAFTAICVIDHVPRRAFTLTTCSLTCLTLMTMGALASARPSTAGIRSGILGCAITFPMLVNLGTSPMLRVLTSEVPHLALRDKSIALYQLGFQVVDFVVSLTLPYILDRIGAQVGFVFAVCAMLSIVWIYFCVPDLTRRSLEELEEMFREKVPARKTRKWKSSNSNSIGTRITALENASSRDSDSVEEVLVESEQKV